MIYLVEFRPIDKATGETVVLRFGSHGYTTAPGDDPPNAQFVGRLQGPGQYDRFLFSRGRTRGESAVGAGEITIVNADGKLDWLLELAFDGRPFTLWGLPDRFSPWSTRQVLLAGSTEQAEFPGRLVSISILGRLVLLREAIQPLAYLGTTTSGGLSVAEGNVDLRDVKKPLLFGSARNIPALTVDQFDNVYQVSSNALAAITAVRDSGVALTATQDYPTLAALKAAMMTGGQFATCLALGLVRTQVRPDGSLTVDAAEGAAVADRSAARLVRRMIGDLMPVAEEDFDLLHEANPAECGLWIAQGETTVLSAAMSVLNSVGGYLTDDRLGQIRVGRFDLAADGGEVTIGRSVILDQGQGFAREATQDDGAGVPARSVTVRYARAYTTLSDEDLKDVAATDAYRSFAKEEWRQVKVESATNKVQHPKGPELVFDTSLTTEADARAEAERLLAIYGTRRDLFAVMVSSGKATTLDVGDAMTLRVDRFGMGEGRALRIVGLVQTFANNLTRIEAIG
ncbi:hypothetical protein [Aureimonas sp. Leaf324]|uniref:hypothetical protein n=1 Tax=Aureimonas sp. Leaf324 TaxID=1736336 RepID=UPI0006F56BAB|nr:hypothetical protein [Aureimonas sp. Leaf324]KQQ81936.1 hypothetical protein ASF65_07730 [Aureimonas sp. Leaf324]